MPDEKLLLDVRAASEMISMGKTFLWDAIRRGELRALKLGRARRVKVSALEEFIERLEAEQVDGKESADREADGPPSTRPRRG